MGREVILTQVKIITPYVFKNEIEQHKKEFWDLDIYYEQDIAGIGSDLMFQKMWDKFPEHDIFILHADMSTHHDGWFEEVLQYVNRYPEAGMFGCLLLYPEKYEGSYIIQSAGGKFTNDIPDHYGSGFNSDTKQYRKILELDENQYNDVREVAWTTFGGCYIRRSFIESVGKFSSEYEWTYNRDVDFCLTARKNGNKIYQIPVRLLHHESKDNNRIRAVDAAKYEIESRNLQTLVTKWRGTEFYTSLNRSIQGTI